MVFFSALSAHATEPIVRIGTIGLSPYGINEQGKVSGLYYDYANLLVGNAGYRSSNKIIPYVRIIKSLQFDDIDLTIMFPNPALENYVNYVSVLPAKQTIVVGLKGTSFNSIEDLSGQRITYLRGAKFNQQIDSDTNIKKYLVSSYILGIRMLLAGRADAIIAPLQSVEGAISELEKTEKIDIELGKPLIVNIRSPWIQLSKKSSEAIDIERLRKSFRELENKNTFQQLKAKYTIQNKP